MEDAATESSCAGRECQYFRGVKDALTQLRQVKAKVARRSIYSGEKLPLNERGQARAATLGLRKIDRRAACRALMAIGPVEFLPRK
jgi:hypothetical protein